MSQIMNKPVSSYFLKFTLCAETVPQFPSQATLNLGSSQAFCFASGVLGLVVGFFFPKNFF